MDENWLEDTVSTAARKLLSVRQSRIKPGTDEKILVSWNGLMLEALALGFRVLGDSRYLESATKTAEFLWNSLRDESTGRLAHTFKDGRATQTGFLDDYSALAMGYLALFEASGETVWVDHARSLLTMVTKHFYSAAESDLFFTPDFHESLILRPREFQDGATPSATGQAVAALVRFHKITGDAKSAEIAEALLQRYRLLLEQVPMASGQLLLALGRLRQPATEVVIAAGPDRETADALIEAAYCGFHPYRLVLEQRDAESSLELFRGRDAIGGKATAFVCENQTCSAPIHDAEGLTRALRGKP